MYFVESLILISYFWFFKNLFKNLQDYAWCFAIVAGLDSLKREVIRIRIIKPRPLELESDTKFK